MTDTIAEPGPDIETEEVFGGSAGAGLDAPVPPVLAAALVAAWGELANLTKDKTATVETRQGGTYSYDYADLADLIEMARPVLARHGLALIPPITRVIGRPLSIDTWLLHSSGYMLRWTFETSGDGSPQALGSAITYARRYCGGAALGIASEGADDDGKAAQAAAVTPPRQTRPKAAPRKATDPLTAKAMALFDRLGYGERDARLTLTSTILDREVESWSDTTARERRDVVDALEARERELRDELDEVDGRSAALDEMEDADRGPY